MHTINLLLPLHDEDLNPLARHTGEGFKLRHALIAALRDDGEAHRALCERLETASDSISLTAEEVELLKSLVAIYRPHVAEQLHAVLKTARRVED